MLYLKQFSNFSHSHPLAGLLFLKTRAHWEYVPVTDKWLFALLFSCFTTLLKVTYPENLTFILCYSAIIGHET